MSGLDGAIQIVVGIAHSCALLDDGTVWCWGSEVGGAAAGVHALPEKVASLSEVTQLSAAYDFTCAVLQDLTVKCWGDRFGLGSPTPVTIPGIEDVRQVLVVSYAGAYVLRFDGGIEYFVGAEALRWDSPIPPAAPEPPVEVVQLAASDTDDHQSPFLCTLLSDGRVRCSGGNTFGQFGTGDRWGTLPDVLGVHDAVEISAGYAHVCALLASGKLRCWGLDDAGQLGIGAIYTNSPYGLAEPADVRGFP